MFDVDADLVVDDRVRPGLGAQSRRGRKLRFPLSLSRAEAYTRENIDSIANTHLQHDLKRHPSIQIQKAQVCSLFLLQLSNV